VGRDSYIYDDSVGGEAISANGYHVGIAIERDSQDIVFDNHHPDGIAREQWMANLLFPSRLYYGVSFQVTELLF
jgi:Papain fold toxin 2